MTNSTDANLRKHLIELLEGGSAHIKLGGIINDFPAESTGVRPEGLPHSAWELLEHLRIAQSDIVLFSSGKGYTALKWPDDYWPASPAPNSENEWKASVESLRKDLASFIDMLNDERGSLFEPFPWADGQTLLREALLIADHNSYHLGQLVLVRQLIGAS